MYVYVCVFDLVQPTTRPLNVYFLAALFQRVCNYVCVRACVYDERWGDELMAPITRKVNKVR